VHLKKDNYEDIALGLCTLGVCFVFFIAYYIGGLFSKNVVVIALVVGLLSNVLIIAYCIRKSNKLEG